MGQKENLERRVKDFRNKVVTRGDVSDMLAHYHQEYVQPLVQWCYWKQLPWWKRLWRTFVAWYNHKFNGERGR